MIYLDNAASTKMSPGVIEAMKSYLEEGCYGNPDSVHSIGINANSMVNAARMAVADAIGAKPEQIIFTSGGTEANNLAILGCGARYGVCSYGEHDSAYNAIMKYPAHKIVRLTNKGDIDYDDLEKVLNKAAGWDAVLAFSAVNNEVGSVNQINKIAELKPADAWLHIDYVQAFGQYSINVNDYAIDSMSLSSHKIHGPQGIGALYVRRPEKLKPILQGSTAQEFGLRPGTKNVLGIVGFGKACKEVAQGLTAVPITTRDLFVKCLLKEMEDAFGDKAYDIIRINGWSNPKIVSLTIRGVDAETLIMMLSAGGVCVSAGSACHAHESKPSRVLTAMGISDADAMCTIRVSFSSVTTNMEVAVAADKIVCAVKTVRT